MLKRFIHRRKPPNSTEPPPKNNAAARPLPPAYRYAPLSTLTATRICVVEPGDPGDPIRCSLEEIDLANAHSPYTALSYVWGSSETPFRVACDGGEIAITKNLHSALRRLRAVGVRAIWADGICINQSKEQQVMWERARQVRTLMGHIYGQAQEVIVDLGEAGEHTGEAIQFLQTAWSPRPVHERTSADEQPVPVPDDAAWRGIADLLTRTWFSRIWVVQEYALASRLQAMVGIQCFDFGLFRNMLHDRAIYAVLQQRIQLEPTAGNKRAHPITHNLLRLEYMVYFQEKNKQDITLGSLIGYSRFFEATLTRDLVYGLLGLCRNPTDLIVDYERSDFESFQNVIQYLISNDHLPVFLAHADGYGHGNALPTWYTNFARPEYRGFRTAQALLDRKLDFQASGGREASARLDRGNAQLRLWGTVCERITSVTAIFSSVQTVDDFFAPVQWSPYNPVGVRKWMQTPLQAELKYGPRDVSGNLTKLADTSMFWETLVGGRCDDSSDLSTPALAKIVSEVRSFVAAASEFYTFDKEGTDPLQVKSYQGQRELRVYFQAMLNALSNLRMCQTSAGRLGIVSGLALPGDMVAVFLGAELPSLLRRVSDDPLEYMMMGNCFIHGIMQGELFQDPAAKIEEVVIK